MFCPKCRNEFREGFTHCQKCGVDLVPGLAPLAEPQTPKNQWIAQILNMKIEDYLNYGGRVLIGVAVLQGICKGSFSAANYVNLHTYVDAGIIAVLIETLFALVKDTLWGLFYIGLGEIIALLKQESANEKAE